MISIKLLKEGKKIKLFVCINSFHLHNRCYYAHFTKEEGNLPGVHSLKVTVQHNWFLVLFSKDKRLNSTGLKVNFHLI